jgi:hypothetical protein
MNKTPLSQPQLLLLLGVACVGLFLLLSFTSQFGKSTDPLSGRNELKVERHLGTVTILPAQKFIPRSVTTVEGVGAQDTIQTGADGDASIIGPHQERIHISESSSVYITRDKQQWTLIIKKGDIQVVDEGETTEDSDVRLTIKDRGTLYALAEYEQDRQKRLAEPNFRNLARVDGVRIDSGAASPKKLSTEIIDQVLQSHRASFFKCYALLLRENPNSKGQSQIDFMIQASGRVKDVQIGFSSIRDRGFQNCLIDSVKSIEFPSFVGEAIQTAFPLRFE